MNGFDELLMSRVKQLRDIEDRLERVLKLLEHGNQRQVYTEVVTLRNDVLLAIQQAEREHAEF